MYQKPNPKSSAVINAASLGGMPTEATWLIAYNVVLLLTPVDAKHGNTAPTPATSLPAMEGGRNRDQRPT